MDFISDFVSKVQSIYSTGNATEHSYRSAFEALFSAFGVVALNEPKRVKCGAPDFIVQKSEFVIGHVEAKDLHIGLRGMKEANKNQQERYKAALPNLIYTNCLDWDFYRDGELVASVTIADLLMGVQPCPNEYHKLENLLKEFISQSPQAITSPKDLAERMAGKANLIKDILSNTLHEDADLQTELSAQYYAFKENLIHDITTGDFADIYSETIAYGMFAARLHGQNKNSFSRQKALELLPKSNPFLRSLFQYVAGNNLDERIAWVIDDLARVFQACDVAKLMEGFGKLTGQNDPFLHFYETFLAAYNPAKRKARGVWYTPEPVVNFIVRAIDEVLQTEFGLADGLADTSKITIDWDTGQRKRTKDGHFTKDGKNVFIKKDVHRVQILDPATGTGTFLAEVIKQIAPKVQGIAPGMWSQYIENDLIPRLHGFELLMASYAMCHMKLDMILTELGYKPTGNPPRLSVYLTNSLEEGEPVNQMLPFAQWLSHEAKGANTIKRDMPIMCVIGNPPYSGHSSNKGEWIESLMADYKHSPELKKPAQAKWLSDDYVKFIRLGEHLIEKNGEGVLGFITNHSYLDNPTFVDMRAHIMKVFDKVYILDLHGSTKRQERTPDGRPDVNVFDIQQGVSIIIGIKRSQKHSKTSPARIFRGDLWGSRKEKYERLAETKIDQSLFSDVTPKAAPWRFCQTDWQALEVYQKFPSVSEIFSPAGRPSPGGVSTQDQFAISYTKQNAIYKLNVLASSDTEQDARKNFKLCSQTQWNFENAKKYLGSPALVPNLVPINYRLFDHRWTVYDRHVFVHRRERLNSHMVDKENLCLVTCRQSAVSSWEHVFVGSIMIDDCYLSNRSKERTYGFPLYLYPDEQDFDQTRQVNFDSKLYKRVQELAEHPEYGKPNEVQLFDYIYGVLHCPLYRETYSEFLKIDFPRIPWPASPSEFWDVSGKGASLRKLHLMDTATIGSTPYPFTTKDGIEGDNVVETPRFEDGRVWINKTQCFDMAPGVSWGFQIGGYKPAQKWLKDRKGSVLSFDDVKHYQRILKILFETDRVMSTITMTLNATE